MTAKRILVMVAVVIAAALAARAACSWSAGAVDVVRPTRGPAVQAVYATGTVEPTVMVPVAGRTSARLMALLADEGQAVKKDQVLGKLEDADLRKNLEQAEAEADLAKKTSERMTTLLAQKLISQEAMDQAATALATANAKADAVRAQLSYMELRAPEDGVVLRRDGEVGQLIPANQPVFWLSTSTALRISSEVDEEDISLVRVGQAVVIRADAFPDKTFAGAVQSITPKGDPVARSYRVRIALTDVTPLMIGMTAETNIIVHEEKDALQVPASAVLGGAVFVARDGKAVRRPVTVGARTKEKVEIRDGVAEEDLVLRKAADIVDGQDIREHLVAWDAIACDCTSP